jgi:sugar phosphate isomerase/epimerase
MYSRRDFGKIALAGLPISAAVAATSRSSDVNGVTLGVMTYSYRDLPHAPSGDAVDAILEALKEDQASVIELYAPGVEPASLKREELRSWRLGTPLNHFKAVRKKFDDAGIRIHAFCMNYRNDFTDEEIDRTFEQAAALGTNTIATSTQVTMAKRLVPFAEKHRIYIAFHGHSNIKNPDEFATPESFETALKMSRYSRINLDIGHFTAAGYDAVSFIQQQHDRITHLHVKDRKKNDGPNVPWGEGDTPIKQVLQLLKEKKYPIPALVEYEYRGTGTSPAEVQKCLDYMRRALA